jgi:putative lipoprotein
MRPALAAAAAVLVLSQSLPARGQASPDPEPEDTDPWFGPDKALHMSAALGVAAGGYVGGVAAFHERWAGVAMGFGIAAALGGIKEGVDASGLGDPSWKDFVWDLVGATLGVGLSVTFDAALRGTEE